MPQPIQGYFAFSLRTKLLGGKNFHCQIAIDEGGPGVKVTGAEVTQAVRGGTTPVDVSECRLDLRNDPGNTLELRMTGRTVPNPDGEPSQAFEASALFKGFTPLPPIEELKGEGEFKEGAEENKPREALLARELKSGGA